MRIDGPSREHLDQLGDAYTLLVEAAMRQAVTVAAKDLRGVSPDFDLAPVRRVMSTEIERTLLPELARQWRVAADDMRDRITEAALTAAVVPPVPANAEQQYLATAANRLVGVSDAVWEAARDQMVLGMQAGESIPQLRDRVTAATGLASPRATVIARTEVIGASNRGAYEQAKASGYQATKTWLATGDSRTRPTHRAANGQVVPMDQEYKVGGISMDGPHDPTAPPSETIQCVIGSTQVSWTGQSVDAVTRRRYDGDLIQIRTARGHELTITPNHPVLTTTGYVPAGLLSPGQYVLATDRPPTPEVDDAPPSIEQVHSASLDAGVSVRVAGRTVDFHGDGTDAEVEVVRTYCDLGRQVDAVAGGKLGEGEFVGLLLASRDGATLGARERRAEPPRVRIGEASASPGGLVRSSRQGTALLGGHGGHADSVGLAGGPDRQADLLQAVGDDVPADSEFARHTEDALALGMTPCKVTQVDRYAGVVTHVYSLQTSGSWYSGSGIAQHNCRCTQTFEFGEGDFDPPATGKKALAAAQGQPPTQADRDALNSYLDTTFNDLLRRDPQARMGGDLQRVWAQTLSQTIAKTRLVETVRGDRVLTAKPGLAVGQVFRDYGFTSLSTVALAGYLVHVTVPEGTPAVALDDSDELLLDRDTRFRVDHVTDDEMWVTVLP